MGADADDMPQALRLAVHELRTPLTVAAGYLRMLLREQAGPLQETQRRMLEEVDRSCGRMAALVSEMSELARLEGNRLTPPALTFNLADVVRELPDRLVEGRERGIRLEVRAPEALEVSGDRARIAAAIHAIVHAVMRERADPGVVLLECSSAAGSDYAWALGAVGDPSAIAALSAEDGAAMAPLDEWRGGTGLTVPIGRRVIEAHGGAVWVAAGDNPRAGVGFRLPLAR